MKKPICLIVKGTTGGANLANKNTQHSSVHAVSPAPNISLIDSEVTQAP